MRLDKKKMIAATIVACTTLFIAIGIHEKKDTRKQLKFGATYMTMNNPYFVNMDENIEESVQAKGDILITRDPLQDQKKQNEQIKDMINEGIDVLFLQPVDRNKVRPALELCKKKHIPVFVIDSEVSDTEAVVSTIVSDNYDAGVQCAKDMMKKKTSASFFIVYRLDFNYNGILLWVFTNLIAHIKDMGGKYALAVISLLSYIGTNHGIISVSTKIFSVSDYINVYDIGVQKVLYWLYNLLTSLNIILFFVFCVFIIIEQSGTIDEVKKLYFKLSQTNEELQQANEKLQEYAVMKEKMGETKERNRLAREIHDTLGHTLTGISAGVDACIAMIDSSPEVTKGQLELISKVTRDGIKEVRRSVSELRPDSLERLNLEPAIRKMVNETNSITNTKIHFECDVEKLKFDEDEENAIYRVVQESMTNSVRHSHAKNVYITIKKKYSDIYISIKDDGIGCTDMKKGFGTRHIVERIKLLNGTVEFDGSDGFTTNVVIPIRWGEEYD